MKPEATGPQERVLFVGDSITDQARSALAGSLPAEDTLDIEAVPGRKFEEMLPFAKQAAEARPAQVVVNLGSNDVLLGEDDAVTSHAMTEMFDLFTGVRCVHVVTVNEGFVFGKDQAAHARRINDQLRRIAAERGYSVIDWNQMVLDYKQVRLGQRADHDRFGAPQRRGQGDARRRPSAGAWRSAAGRTRAAAADGWPDRFPERTRPLHAEDRDG